MAPLDRNSTKRYWLDYATANNEHSIMMRVMTPVTTSEASDAFDGLLAQLDPVLYLITVTGMRVAEKFSDVSNPVAFTGEATYGADAEPGTAQTTYLAYMGRTLTGRRVRVAVYGYKGSVTDNFRLSSAEDANAYGGIAELGSYNNRWVGIDELDPLWQLYVNVGFNAFWQRQARK